MTININIDSICSLIGAVIAITFAIYYFTSNLFIRKERLSLFLSAFMFSVFIYLFSYSCYSSSTNAKNVLFWTRLCYSGGASAIVVGYLLISEIIQKESEKLKYFMISLTIFLIVLIYLPSDLFFTKELNPGKTHSSVIKGPYFPYLLMTIYLADIVVLFRFFKGCKENKEKLYLMVPIFVALVYWFIEAVFDGVFGAIFSLVNMKFSLGPIIMTFSLSLFSGRYSERRDSELIRIKKENKDIYKNLIYDNLSSLFSRKYFLEVLEQRAAVVRREHSSDCLMFLDVDNFKSVNDELGHNFGDDLIGYIGAVLNSASRKSDVCARYGGDEFLILLENCEIENSGKIADTLQRKLNSGLGQVLGDWSGKKNISFSIGIVSSRFWGWDPSEIVQMADMAMYMAKKKGRCTSFFYSEKMVKSG